MAVLLLVSGLGSDVRHASLQVKYLDIDHSDPNDLKFDYNMRLFKNVPKLYLTLNLEPLNPPIAGGHLQSCPNPSLLGFTRS